MMEMRSFYLFGVICVVMLWAGAAHAMLSHQPSPVSSDLLTVVPPVIPDPCLLSPVPTNVVANGFDTDEQFLYRSDGNDFFVHDAITFAVVGSINLGSSISAIQVDGDRAYVIVGNDLVVLDISDRSEPFLLGQHSGDVSRYIFDNLGDIIVSVDNDFIYLIDTADPTSMSLVGEIELVGARGALEDWELVGTTLYVLFRIDPQLFIVDLSDPVNPVVRQKFIIDPYNYRYPQAISYMNGRLYLGHSSSSNYGYWILDIDRPFVPEVIETETIDAAFGKIGSREQFGVLYTRYSGVHLLDISDPDNPITLAEIDSSDWNGMRFSQIRFSNNRLFIRRRFSELYTLSLSGCLGWCSRADQAAPHGELDYGDIQQFMSSFLAGDPEADFAAPFGELDFFDVADFLLMYSQGCP